MIVVDASAVVLGLLDDGDARAMLRDESIVCPHLIDVEVVSALRSQVRRGEVDGHDADRAIETWVQLGVERVGVTGLLPRIWALRDNLSAYDAAYVALAEALAVPLLTADGRLARAPGPTCTMTIVRS